MKKGLTFFFTYWFPVVVLAGIIFKLSSGDIPKASNIFWQDFAVKKIAHICVYGILAVLVYRALLAGGTQRKKAVILAILIATLYGATDEVHQFFTQGRESRLRDVGFDGVGAMAAMYFTVIILPRMPNDILSIGKKFEII